MSTRKGGGFYGYKLHMASCTLTDLPIAWEVRPANNHDSKRLAPLLDRLPWPPETVFVDKGYDYDFVVEECVSRGVALVIARKRKSETVEGPILRDSERWGVLYRARTAVEREFARLKELGLDAFRLRRIERVQVHADLCVLSRLVLALG